MKGIVFEKNLGARYLSVDEPEINLPYDVKIRIVASGICGTDLRILAGHFPARDGTILGHEAVGIVEALGSQVTSVQLGDRVILDPTLHCGQCRYCQTGRFNLCDFKAGTEVGVDRNGTFSEFTILPENFVHRIPDEMSFDKALLIEPLACVLNNLDAGEAGYQDHVVVLGAGPIGMITALVAQRFCKDVTVVEKNPQRLQFARGKFGRVLDSDRDDFPDFFQKNAPLVDLVIDTTGVLMELGLKLCAKGSRLVLMGFNNNSRVQINPLEITMKALRITGAGDYNLKFPKAIEIAALLPLEELITHRFALGDFSQAFSALLDINSGKNGEIQKPMMKVVFDFAKGN